MEQRRSDRKAVTLSAVLACSRFGLIRGEITDLASSGLYFRAETSIVPLGAAVSVTFQPGSEICDTCLTIKGRVAHQSLHGFGVEFGDIDAECREALARLLPGLPSVPRRALPVLRAV